nr:hypothetical protein [Streptomyces sp. AS58]
MRTPPSDGPPVWVIATVPDMKLLREFSSALSTIFGRSVQLPTSDRTFAKLVISVATSNCP